VSLNAFAAGVGPDRDFSGTIASSSAIPGTGFRLLAVTADGASGRQELHVDGARVAASSHPFALDAKGKLVVGGHRPGAGNCHAGCNADLAELLIYHRALSPDERAGLERHLQAKWGLRGLAGSVTPLASRLPFAYYPTTREIELAFDKEAELLHEHLAGVPRQERNPFVLDGERDGAAGLWGLRDYYKRVWKQIQRLERDRVPPLPLDFTIHATNCMLLPMHTWCTNILDLEQPYRKGKPFPPDYTRAMTSGRHAGVVAHGMYPLANYNDYRDAATNTWTEEQALADWAMYRVHEVRSSFYADWRQEWKQWKSLRDAMAKAGYGDPKALVDHRTRQAPVGGEADLPGRFGTALLWAVTDPAAAPGP
jgi:hypothetical protein